MFGEIYHYLDERYKEFEAWVRFQGDIWDERTGGLVGLFWRPFYGYTQKGVWEAAAMSYLSLVSLFPLLMILVAGIGQVLGPAAAGSQLQDFLTVFLPGRTAIELSRTVERFAEEGGITSLVASVFLLWSSSSLFSALTSSLDRIFRVQKTLVFWKRRLVGLVMIVILGFLLTANLITSAIFSFLDILFLNQTNIWVQIGGLLLPFGFSMGIFATMYRFIPRQRVGWDAIWTASLFSSLIWEFAKVVFGLYLDYVAPNLSLIYGSLATVMFFMLWAYYTWSIVIIGAEFCVNLEDLLEMRRKSALEHDQIFAGDYYLRELNPKHQLPPELP